MHLPSRSEYGLCIRRARCSYGSNGRRLSFWNKEHTPVTDPTSVRAPGSAEQDVRDAGRTQVGYLSSKQKVRVRVPVRAFEPWWCNGSTLTPVGTHHIRIA